MNKKTKNTKNTWTTAPQETHEDPFKEARFNLRTVQFMGRTELEQQFMKLQSL